MVLSLRKISILPCLLEIQLGLHKATIVPYSASFRPFRQRVSRLLKWTGSTPMDWYFLLSLPLPALMMLVGMQKLASWRCCRQKVHHLQYLVRVCQRCFYVKTWTHLVKVLSETSLRCSNCIYRLEYAHDSIMTLQVQGQVQVTTHDSFPIDSRLWLLSTFFDLQLQPMALRHELPQVLVIDDPQCWNQFPGDIHLHKFSLFDIAVAPSTVIFSRDLLPTTFCTAAVHHSTIEQVCLPRQFRKPWK